MNGRQNKYFRYILFILIPLIIVLGLGLLFRDYIFVEEREVEEESDQKEELVLENTGFELFDDDYSREWALTAERMVYFREQEEIEISPVTIDIFDLTADRKHIYSLTAGWGKYDEKEETLYLYGGVKVEENGARLETENLIWFQQENIIRGEGGFWLETSDYILKGQEFESDSLLENVETIGGEERVYFRIKEE